MKYRPLVEKKLEQLANIQTSIDSLTMISAPKNEVRALIVKAKELIAEIQSLINKEN